MNIIDIEYNATGSSLNTNCYGMREMQARAFEARESQYILLKAPPASGKSRALMFIGLDKLINQNIEKVIVAVPERSIGGSFRKTDLMSYGFYADWSLSSEYDLCMPGGADGRKTDRFIEFMESNEKILLCTHATLRFAFAKLKASSFDQCLVAVDEFHHVSADYENKLGELIRDLMCNSSTHILAMTGSYFRGDSVPVLMPADEEKFYKVTYNYYEQLNGYKNLKSLGIGYHFYQGEYVESIGEVLDTDKKTIIHIPHPNSVHSTKDKLGEVDAILDVIGKVINIDVETKIIEVQRTDGIILKVADLVTDDENRIKVLAYLRDISSVDDIDIIIALGMAKEGFDWPYCEHALTVAYRGSLTEIIQIIGRCTRDSPNKVHAQFTNLIAEPDAEKEEVVESVNNMLKAITASLLMEQVLAPSYKFMAEKPKNGSNEIRVNGFKNSDSPRVKNIIESDLTDLKAAILQDPEIVKAMPGNVAPQVINEQMIPKVVKMKYPALSDAEVMEVSQYVVIDSVIKHARFKEEGDRKLIRLTDSFINIEDINVDLINSINPFMNAFEVLSKSLTPRVLKAVQQSIAAFKIKMTDDEALLLWPKINDFYEAMRRRPSLDALDPLEKRMAEALVYLTDLKRQQVNNDEG